MSFIANLGWFGKSLIVGFAMMPIMVLTPIFFKYMRPEAFMVYWLLGAGLGLILLSYNIGVMPKPTGLSPHDLVPNVAIGILWLLGLTCGVIANTLLGQAIAAAPNPALPPAIIGIASAFAYILAALGAFVLPQYFSHVTFNWHNFLGILLLVGGVFLISYQPTP